MPFTAFGVRQLKSIPVDVARAARHKLRDAASRGSGVRSQLATPGVADFALV